MGWEVCIRGRSGACRVCSVEVAMQADGPRRVVASCHTPIAARLHVFTESANVMRLWRVMFEGVITASPPEYLPLAEDGKCTGQRVGGQTVGGRCLRERSAGAAGSASWANPRPPPVCCSSFNGRGGQEG